MFAQHQQGREGSISNLQDNTSQETRTQPENSQQDTQLPLQKDI